MFAPQKGVEEFPYESAKLGIGWSVSPDACDTVLAAVVIVVVVVVAAAAAVAVVVAVVVAVATVAAAIHAIISVSSPP